MTTFVFRNTTVEPFLGYDGMTYSGYGDISLVAQDVDRYIWFYQVPPNADSEQLAQEIESYRAKLDLVLDKAGTGGTFIIFSLVNLFKLRLTGCETVVEEAIADFNSHAAQLAATHSHVKWIDFSEFTMRYDAERLLNWKYYYMSQTMLNPKLVHDFQAWWSHLQVELAMQRKKCLVLDLDNTLWGGVLGEDGVDGIVLGGDYPGNAYSDWQKSLLHLSHKGVILAVCSKNNMEDVQEAWDKNAAMVLKKEHFGAMRINWQDKATNLQELADDLNIGLDSFVFVDDNPVERELVRQMLPQVEVPDFPEKPYQLMSFFRTLVDQYFRIYQVTAEDIAKTSQYRANALRKAEQSRFTDLEDYLYSLDIAIDVIPADSHNLPRIAQMTQKTNQFNLTTHRYGEDEVRRFLSEGWHIFCMAVSDRFGDNGITGTIFLRPVDEKTVDVETLLLSCRILGRGIEEAFFKTVLNVLRLNGYRRVTATYVPTAKNGQTADFYDRMGMECVESAGDGTKRYMMPLDGVHEIKNCYNIRVL